MAAAASYPDRAGAGGGGRGRGRGRDRGPAAVTTQVAAAPRHPKPVPRVRDGAGGLRCAGMMPPVLLRLFTLASAASLVLCVGACVLWVRGHGGTPDAVGFPWGGALWRVVSERGRGPGG